VLALAALGLNLLTGYAGNCRWARRIHGGGALVPYARLQFQLRIEGIPILLSFVLAGLCAAAVGVLFGLPSLRIKVSTLPWRTLAAQFFVVGC